MLMRSVCLVGMAASLVCGVTGQDPALSKLVTLSVYMCELVPEKDDFRGLTMKTYSSQIATLLKDRRVRSFTKLEVTAYDGQPFFIRSGDIQFRNNTIGGSKGDPKFGTKSARPVYSSLKGTMNIGPNEKVVLTDVVFQAIRAYADDEALAKLGIEKTVIATRMVIYSAKGTVTIEPDGAASLTDVQGKPEELSRRGAYATEPFPVPEMFVAITAKAGLPKR